MENLSAAIESVPSPVKVKVQRFYVSNECIDDDGNWDASVLDVSNVTNFASTLQHCTSLKSLDLSTWDTSNAISFNSMLYGCSNLEELILFNDVSKCTNFNYIFSGCHSIVTLDLTKWEVLPSATFSSFLYPLNKINNIVGGRSVEDVIRDNVKALSGASTTIGLSIETIDRASLRAVINGVADLTDSTTQTLILGNNNKRKLTEEDIAIATSKNWAIS